MQNDWVSWRHVSGQAGLSESADVRWVGPLSFLGTQFALLLGYWFVAWVAALVAYRPWKETDDGIRYLWWTSAPMFGVFLFFSLKTTIEPNWPVTAYLSGLVLAGAWLARRAQSPRLWLRRLTYGGVATTCGLGLAVTFLMHESGLAQPVLLRLSGPATSQRPLPLRRFDPTCRLRGWRYLATEVDRVRARLQSEGTDAVIFCSSWTLPGELGFYCDGHPVVYSVGFGLGDRQSQYDLWHPNPLANPEQFRGRTVIFIGEPNNLLPVAFEQVEEPIPVVYRERGQPVASWTITVCRGFKAFPHAGAHGRY